MGIRDPLKVVRLPFRHTCARCGQSADQPHHTERQCIRAIDAEMRRTVDHYRTLTKGLHA